MNQPVPGGPRPRPELVSFIVPVRDDARRLESCLASLQAAAGDVAIELVVADNGSVDDSAVVARRAGARVLDLAGLPVAAVRNRASMAASGELLAFVDADHLVGHEWVDAAVAAACEPGIGGAGALCHAPTPGTWVQQAYDRLRARPASRHDVEWLGAGNLVVWRDVFTAVGGFDESLETCEDVDLCNRIRLARWRLLGEPRMHNVHLGDPSTLKALFLGELWRGRDNIRVTLRGPLTWRALPSLLMPVVNLVALATAVLTLPFVLVSHPAALAAAAATATFLATVVLRMVRMKVDWPRPLTLLQNAAVALVYELGRALALVMRATHQTRRAASQAITAPDQLEDPQEQAGHRGERR